jgi:hypothetical protein
MSDIDYLSGFVSVLIIKVTSEKGYERVESLVFISLSSGRKPNFSQSLTTRNGHHQFHRLCLKMNAVTLSQGMFHCFA